MLWAGNHIAGVILLFLASYGLWMLVFSLWHTLNKQQQSKKLFISILIIAHNDEEHIEGIVRWLLNLDYVDEKGCPNLEIVAISGGSEDQTPAILERLSRKEPRLITKSVSLAQAAYEEGLNLCRGDVIFLLDLSKHFMSQAGYAMGRMLNE
ncbi:MAG: glycosyltransferase [Firmicutes bacterium]|nr:glycosyltransferase [Bacillota bacterium]